MKDKPVTVTLFACSSIYCLNYKFQNKYITGHLSITINLKAFLAYPFDRIYDLLVCLSHTFYSIYLVRIQEASTALIRRLRKPPLSMTCRAWMVAPPGEHTLSLSCPGCCSESSSILAAPFKKDKGRQIR